MKKLLGISLFALSSALFIPQNCGAQYTVLYNFISAIGEYPCGALTPSGSLLYGTANQGGYYGYGCIFSFDTIGNVYTDRLDFNGTNGRGPFYGSLAASGNLLFGTTQIGGASNFGCIYSFATTAFANKVLHSFSGGTDGIQPLGSVTLSGSKLFGMTIGGGTYNKGCIFSIDTNGNGYKILHSFDSLDGRNPQGSLILSGNVIYGMTTLGGTNNDGVIFSIDSNGSSYTKLLDFNGANGSEPRGALILSGTVLYGMAYSGGALNYGCMFSFNTSGNVYTDLLDFNSTNGANPTGSLILSGTTLYGMTTNGGTNSIGCAFSFNLTGSIYTHLIDFITTNGSWPWGDLGLFGNKLYGMTHAGGFGNDGLIFSFRDTNVTTSLQKVTSDAEAINVYPNPATDYIVFESSVNNPNLRVEIYNVVGQLVQTGKLNPGITTIRTSNLARGLYLYRVFREGSVLKTGKIVLQ